MTEIEWPNKCDDDIKQRSAMLYRTSQWSDCTLLVGEHEIPYKSHKLILAMASPVFEAMFFQNNDEGTDTCKLPDISSGAFSAMLNYIYTENINIESFEEAYELYVAASKYIIPQLTIVSALFMSCNLSIDNVCLCYQAACYAQDHELRHECEQVILPNIREILNQQKSFQSLDIDTVARIFELDGLWVSDVELYDALRDYTQVLSTRKREADSTPEQTTGKLIRPALQKIRFLTFTLEAFAKGPAASGWLTASECMAILTNIAGGDRPMPEGFCTNKVPRIPRPPEPVPPPTSAHCTLSLSLGCRDVATLSHTSAPASLLQRPWLFSVVPVTHCATSNSPKQLQYIGVFLRCERVEPPPWGCRVSVEFILRAFGPGAVNKTERRQCIVTGSHNSFGDIYFISVQKALDRSNDYVKDDMLMFDARIDAQIIDRMPVASTSSSNA